MPTRRTFRFGIILALLCLLALTNLAFAQDAAPIQIGQNAIGELTAETTTVSYAFTSAGGETASIQVLALSPNFAPRFRVLNPAGVEILTASNPNALSSLTADASFADADNYIIEVSGENGTLGQFVISLQAGASLPEPVELVIDQPVSGTIGSTPLAVYRFAASPTDLLILTILSETPDSGILISLYDENAGKTIATNDATLSGVAYRLPPREADYRVEIRAGSTADTPYTLCLGTCEASLLADQTPQIAVLETPEVTAANCTVVSTTGGTINVRSGAGTQFTIIGNLSAAQSLPAIGRLADSSWVQVVLSNGQQGWVGSSVTRLDGDCASLPIVSAPANAALAPTQPPAPTNPPPPTASSGSGSTSPTAMPTTAPTTEPPPAVTLPDLSVTISYAQIAADGRVDIGYSIVVRDVTNPFSHRLQICIDDTCISEDMTALSSSSSATSKTLDIIADGRRIIHRATVTVDSTGDVVESNESNNLATYNFQ